MFYKNKVNLYHILSSIFGEKNDKIYQTQYKLSNETIADAVVFGPQPLGTIAVDSKFPLENYRRLVEKGLSENPSSETEKLLSMAKLYNFNKKQIYKYILLPGCRPAFLGGLESCFGLCWKVTVAGEVLSLPRNGCGSLLQKFQVHLETDSVMAITIILVLLSFLFQNLLRLICKNWEVKN